MNTPNLELIGGEGLVCDNPSCDWKDPSVTFENFDAWLNVPCPKCGQNVLTQEDFDTSKKVREAAAFVNGLTIEQIKDMARLMGLPDEVDPNERMTIEMHAHKGLHITRVSDSDAPEQTQP